MSNQSKFYFSFILIIIISVGMFSYKIIPTYANVTLQDAQANKAQLESELSILEKEIAVKQKQLNQQKGQSASISRDVSILTTQINKAKLNIRAQNLIIQKLGGEISKKDTQIQGLVTKMNNELASLAQLIRKQRQIENTPIIVLMLSKNTISSVYGDLDAFSSIKNGIKTSIEKIKIVKIELENKKNKVIDTKNKLETSKKEVLLSEQAKQKLLSISKNKEFQYKEIINQKAKRKAEILSALFRLRDASAIPFSTALKYANLASSKTGVRPAFLLAILTQESNLGANQGSCYVTDFKTGNGIIIKSGKFIRKVMRPMDFLTITSKLGRNPFKTIVSCPINGYGYGGAMGPSQFIPSTWQGVRNRVSKILNVITPDPWNPKDAFMASALYLKDLGAIRGGYTAEKNAACRYYSGSSCSNPRVRNAFYGNSVMAKAVNIQKTMIDPLQN